jgi:hypothetical protein
MRKAKKGLEAELKGRHRQVKERGQGRRGRFRKVAGYGVRGRAEEAAWKVSEAIKC